MSFISYRRLRKLLVTVTGYEVDETFARECRRWLNRKMAHNGVSPGNSVGEAWLKDRLLEYMQLPGVI